METPLGPALYDTIIRGATIYDGSGGAGYRGDVAIRGDRIAAVGNIADARAQREFDASGLAIAPGFINTLSWSTSSLIVDGRAQSVVRQGVTTEIMGEGFSWGPFPEGGGKEVTNLFGEYDYPVDWRTLGEYLEKLEKRGVSVNVGSFVGSATLRIYVAGLSDAPLTGTQYDQMKRLMEEAMREGALGLGSAMMYVPDTFNTTKELIGLARIAGEHGGSFIAHMRDEGFAIEESIAEMIEIAEKASVPVEIYHLKVAGKDNWGKLDKIIDQIEGAQARGIDLRANMYTYTAGSSGLDAAMPPWVQEGGIDSWIERLTDPEVRRRVAHEMRHSTEGWSNTYLEAGSPDNVIIVGVDSEELRPFIGKSLAEIAALWAVSPEEAAMDLVIQDRSRLHVVYFMMSEENVRRQIALPWVSFGSDGEAMAPEGVFLKNSAHPRSYGNFARLLGKYVREERVIPLGEAIRKLTSLPAENFKLRERGRIAPGYFADLVLFDPATVGERATYEAPHQYAQGVEQVWVNGIQVIADGEHNGALPGRVLRGPGWSGWSRKAERD
ncbi:D-aminoacylase [Pacificimonas sp. WHA3]|uniref:D-aminoacylase n=1 Tax=Pacificimonas pallii TaxID=2827236 RepID=A0ABS6SAA9_9SPHN|nr:D-aminoacylase [Pacificimonas pallii]